MKNKLIPHANPFLLCRTALVLACSLFFASLGHAQTAWAKPSGNWEDFNNWSAGVPNSGTVTTIDNAGTAEIFPSANPHDTSDIRVGDIASGFLNISFGAMPLNSSGTATVGRFGGSNGVVNVEGTNSAFTSWRIQNALIVGQDGNGTLNIFNEGSVSSALLRVSALSGVGLVTVSGSNSVLSTTGAIDVGQNGKGTLQISAGGAVNAGGQVNLGTSVGSDGLVTVTGANSTFTVNNSLDLIVGNSGTGQMEISNGGAVTVGTGGIGTKLTLANDIANGKGTLIMGANNVAAGDLHVAEVTGHGDAQIVFNHNAIFNYIFAPLITERIAVTQIGSGTVIFTQANTYTDGTSVNFGTLLANNSSGSATGNGNVIVGQFGTIGGSGKYSGDTTVDGTLKPGNVADGLTFGSNLTFGSGSATVMEITGAPDLSKTQYDDVTVLGMLMMNGTLMVQLTGYVPVNGDSFDLFDWAGQSGTFATMNLPTLGPGQSWFVDDFYNSGTLTVVPEPSTWALMILGSASLGFVFFRRQARAKASLL